MCWSTRLGFFILRRKKYHICRSISPDLIDWVGKVKYEDRLGSDFDHKEVTLQLGTENRIGKITIGDGILDESTVTDISN